MPSSRLFNRLIHAQSCQFGAFVNSRMIGAKSASEECKFFYVNLCWFAGISPSIREGSST